jgi:hypothetical protein
MAVNLFVVHFGRREFVVHFGHRSLHLQLRTFIAALAFDLIDCPISSGLVTARAALCHIVATMQRNG